MANLNKYTPIQFPIVLLDKFVTALKIPKKYSLTLYKIIAWVTTYFWYFSLFYSYTILGSVKGTINPLCTYENGTVNLSAVNRSVQNGNCSGWEPFIGNHGNTLLGILDFAALFSFAIFNGIIGNISDYFDYRYSICICGTLLFSYSTFFGSGYYLGIHSFPYYLVTQLMLGIGGCGMCGCIGVLGKWFDGKRSGIILGIWGTSGPIGRILGKLLPSIWADHAWGASFYSGSLLIGTATLLIFLLLVPEPEYLSDSGNKKTKSNKKGNQTIPKSKGIRIWSAFCIPGVLEYSLALFFISIAFYSSLYWFPYLISTSRIEGVKYQTSTSSIFSAVFDIGSIAGTVIGGGLSDLLSSYAIIITLYLYLATLLFYCYYLLYTVKLAYNILLLFSLGLTIGSTYVIVANSIPVVLGSHKSLKGNSNSVATLVGIILAVGCVGGGLGGFLAGYLFRFGISAVLFFMMASAFTAGILLTRITMMDSFKVCKMMYNSLKCNHHVYVVNSV